MTQRIYGLENEYGLIFSPNGRIYLPMEKVLGYIFEGLIPNMHNRLVTVLDLAQREPQSLQYTTHGDLWDYIYDGHRARRPGASLRVS